MPTYYFLVGFASGAGTLAAGATAEIGSGHQQERLLLDLHADERLLVQQLDELHDDPRSRVYLNGSLVYGTVPIN